MNVFCIVTWWTVCVTFLADGKRTDDSDVDQEDVGSVDYTNASMYTTSEMRERVLAEWKGKTEEIQGYFDQLPSEEFKENSEDLKFKYYYERKGAKGIHTNQVLNITPHQYHEPTGPMYTIEVNDSYVPKYRVTTSEEERMEKYGTFNSESESESPESSEEEKKKKRKKKKESSESGSGKDKTKKEKKTRPANLDAKEKQKKKKPKTTDDEKKRKDLVEKSLNGVKNVKLNIKRIQKENKEKNENILQQGNIMDFKIDERKFNINRKSVDKAKDSGLYTGSNKVNRLKTNRGNGDYKLIDNDEIEKKLENIERKRKRSRQSINRKPLQPYL